MTSSAHRDQSRAPVETYAEGFVGWVERLAERVESLELNVAGHERQIGTLEIAAKRAEEERMAADDWEGAYAVLRAAILQHEAATYTRRDPNEADRQLWRLISTRKTP